MADARSPEGFLLQAALRGGFLSRSPRPYFRSDPEKRPSRALARLLVRVVREDDGGEVMEYPMKLGFLAVACYVLVTMVGMKFVDVWQRVDRVLGELG
jgi:hypothetical protein